MPTPLPVIPATYWCYLWALTNGLKTGNVYCFRASSVPTGPAEDQTWAQALADALPLEWGSTMAPLYPNPTVGWDSRVYALGSPTNPAALGPSTHAGTQGFNLAAFPTAAVIRHNVLRRGRGSQSHSAISPLTIDKVQTDGQTLTDAHRLALTTEFENFIGQVQANFTAAISGITIDYVQLSKKGAGTTYPITGSFAESLVGSERSRTLRP